MRLNFSGKRVLLLGGSCDLALTLAQYLIEEALFPVLTYRSEEGRRRIDEIFADRQGKYETAFLDFSDSASIGLLFQKAGADLDYLVDFAQGDLEGFIASADQDSVARYITENITRRAGILKEAARLMLTKRRGRLVFISSAAALRANPGQGYYAAAKLASETLYRNLGMEMGKRGITTVTLRPGYVNAGRGHAYIQANEKELLKRIPAGRVLTKEEVAEAIMFLLSDGASGFNATELMMDGGLTAGK
jgi:3-oxoacyl-[acyl-carrier protein] reductase